MQVRPLRGNGAVCGRGRNCSPYVRLVRYGLERRRSGTCRYRHSLSAPYQSVGRAHVTRKCHVTIIARLPLQERTCTCLPCARVTHSCYISVIVLLPPQETHLHVWEDSVEKTVSAGG